MQDFNRSYDPFQKKIRVGTIPPEATGERELPLSSVFEFDLPDGNYSPTAYAREGWNFKFNTIFLGEEGKGIAFEDYSEAPETISEHAVIAPVETGGSFYLQVNFNGVIKSVELT